MNNNYRNVIISFEGTVPTKEVFTIFTTGFYRDLAERTIATFAQALGAVLVAAGTGILEVDWVAALSVAAMAALLAVLKSFAASAVGSDTGASFGTAIPRASVAAVEDEYVGQYRADEAAPYTEGTPVDIVPERDDFSDHDHSHHH